jgi:hypothetical protein
MPDYCYNTITGSPEDIQAVLDIMKSEKSVFDFERIIPMPEILWKTVAPIQVVEDQDWDPAELDKPEIRTLSKSKHDEFMAQFGAADWYNWSRENWGTTKPPSEIIADVDRITFVTAWKPPTHVIAALADRLPNDAELNVKWELDQGNGAEYLIADNMVHDVEFWSAPGFENPLDGVPDIRRCYLTGGRGNTFVQDYWYAEDGNGSTKGYGSALEAIVFEEIDGFDPEDEEITEDFWEAYEPADGLRVLNHIQDAIGDLTDEQRSLIQHAHDTVPTQEISVGPKA